MPAVFTQSYQNKIESAVLIEFDCAPLSSGVRREDKHRRRRREVVTGVHSEYFIVMNGENPPQSRKEAISATVGAIAMLLQFIFPQYALMIKIAGWIWDFTHE